MNELALFTGTGAGLLATQWLGLKTACAVELDWYCRCVLTQRQNERNLRSSFPIWDDIRTFDGRPWRGRIDVITGGFPCQAYSTAAAGKNNADDLWCEMQRIISEVSPVYVFAENVERKAINKACDELESMGYKTKALSLSAKDLGGDHLRERHWLLAYANDKGKLFSHFNAKAPMLQKLRESIWQADPFESGVDDGDANRMDRFKAIGNGQVPIVAIEALMELASHTIATA